MTKKPPFEFFVTIPWPLLETKVEPGGFAIAHFNSQQIINEWLIMNLTSDYPGHYQKHNSYNKGHVHYSFKSSAIAMLFKLRFG